MHLNLFLRFLFNAVFLVELLNTSIGSCSLLLTGVERMALRANFYVDFRLCGAGHESIAAVAGYSCLIVLGMDSFFHRFHLSMIITVYFVVLIRTAYGTTNSGIIVT